MKIWQTLQQAFAGWLMILRGEAGWESRFRLTMPGLATALVMFYAFACLAIVLASFRVGVPTLGGFLDVMVVQSLWLLALLIGVFVTRNFLKDTGSPLPLLIPAIYALIAYLILGALVSMTIGILLPLLWIGLAFMFFRLARVASAWTIGVSAAFAALTLVLLVGLPMTLYMLATTFSPIA